jgi:hypothetical protein
MYRNAPGFLVVPFFLAVVVGCETAVPLAVEDTKGSSAESALRTKAPVDPARHRAQVAEFVRKLREAMAQPNFLFGANRSDGQAMTPAEVLSDWEARLARLEAAAWGKDFSAPLASRAPSSSLSSSSGIYVSGYTVGYVHRDPWCSDAVVGASSASDITVSTITVTTFVDYMVSTQSGAENRGFTLYNVDYATNNVEVTGANGVCAPYEVAGGFASSHHEAWLPGDYGSGHSNTAF